MRERQCRTRLGTTSQRISDRSTRRSGQDTFTCRCQPRFTQMPPNALRQRYVTIRCYRSYLNALRSPSVGGDVHAQDNLGQTAAHFSAMHNHADVLKYLVHEKHLDPCTANHRSKRPIHYAAKHGSAKALTFLVQADTNVHASDAHGNTIAHEASEYNQVTCIQLIWKSHRDLFHEKNHAGRTPIHTVLLNTRP